MKISVVVDVQEDYHTAQYLSQLGSFFPPVCEFFVLPGSRKNLEETDANFAASAR
jgi:hypothetical protein